MPCPHRLHPHPARPTHCCRLNALPSPPTPPPRTAPTASTHCCRSKGLTGLQCVPRPRSDPNSARVRCLFFAGFDACLCLSALGKVGHRPKRSLPALHTGYIYISFSNATLLVLISTAALQDWGSAALAAASKSGSAAGPFCGRGRGLPKLGEAVKAKPLRLKL